MTDAEVERVALRAAKAKLPDAVLTQALSGLDLPRRERLRVWRRMADRVIDELSVVREPVPTARKRVLQARGSWGEDYPTVMREIWRMYDAGHVQRAVADRVGRALGSVRAHSARSGWRMTTSRYATEMRALEGPCMGCLAPFPREELDHDWTCEGCRQ